MAAVVPRVLLAGGCLAVALGALAWSEQSRLIGIGARWWFERVAAQEQGADAIARRRGVLAELHRRLLLAPPADVHVPELFELVTQLSARVATGEVSLPWAYVYTTYERDLLRDRPAGAPRRSPDEVAREVARLREFYAIAKRPDVDGITAADLLATGDDVITLDEIEQADRDGTRIDLRTRGARRP